MTNKNQKQENKPESEQPTTSPAAPVELSEEALKHVVGGTSSGGDRPTESLTFQPDPTAVE